MSYLAIFAVVFNVEPVLFAFVEVRCPRAELVMFWFPGLAVSFPGLAFQVIEVYQAMFAVYV